MEDLQAAIQSVLSDPAQLAQIAALAESLGLKPPEQGAEGSGQETGREGQTAGEAGSSGGGRASETSAVSAPGGLPGPESLDLGSLMAGLNAMQGAEARVLGALRPTLTASGQAKADRALRAAKLARLAGQLLRRGREGRV